MLSESKTKLLNIGNIAFIFLWDDLIKKNEMDKGKTKYATDEKCILNFCQKN